MPERIEDYEVLGIIGTGSFGTCYKVRKKNTSHIFVWKAVDYGSMSEDRKKLLVSEVNLLRELKHPNIVRYYDRILHKESATIYIIMELCEKGDLATFINKCRRNNTYADELFVWKVLYQSSRALQACHGPGRPVLHRDIKPANLFLDSAFNIKLGDFGLARVLNPKAGEEEDMDNFCAQTVVGTPFYMSPEVVRGNKYNRKSDIWSLGCVIYELCSLSPPFACSNVKTLAQRIKEGRFSRIPSHYSDELHQIIVFMLTADHEVRPSIETILHHPSVVSHIAEWSRTKSLYRKQNIVMETNLSVNKNEILLNETFCSCTNDCCANEMPPSNAQIGITTALKQAVSQKEFKPNHSNRLPSMQTVKMKHNSELDDFAEPERLKEVDPGVKKETTVSIVERLNLLRQREVKLRMRELTLEERERTVRRKEREAALASRLARETMGRACVYLKSCRDGRESAFSTTTKTTLGSRSPNEDFTSLPDADSSLDQEHGETSTIATTSARLDPRSISKPFWNGSTTGTRRVTFGSKNSRLLDELYVDTSAVDNTKNAELLTAINCKRATNLRPGSWSEGQAWLEAKKQVYRENVKSVGKENVVPRGQKVNKISTKRTSLPQLNNLEKYVKTLR